MVRHALLFWVLFDYSIQIFKSVEDVDADTAIKSSRFENPNILPLVMSSWDFKFSTLKTILPWFNLFLQFELNGQSQIFGH